MLRVPALPSNVVRELSFAGRARPVAPSVPAIRPRDAALAIMRSLSNADVRALAALVASPSLIASSSSPVALLDDGWRLATLLERREWLTALDADPSSLIAHLARSNARQLGRYAEALWQFWFAQLPGAQVHAVGLPVKEGGAVRGEFDFIVTLPALPGVQHLETGYKFFLHAPTDADESRCIGPNPADRLDRKWRHMVDAQLPLSQNPLGRAALPSSLANMPITPRACLQGYIFYPFGNDKPRLTKLAPDHAHGWWSRFDKAISRPPWTTLASAWTALPKLRWIAPARVAKAEASPMSGDLCQARLAAHFSSSRQAQLLGGLACDRDGHWHETVRVFIVHPDWPSTDSG